MRRFQLIVLIGLVALGAVYAGTGKARMTRAENNKLLVKVAIGAMNAGDFETMAEVYSPKFIQHAPGRSEPLTWADFELGCRIMKNKLPTLSIEIEDIIAEGNKVAVRLKTVVTYKNGYAGNLSGAGKVEFTEIDIMRIEGGRIVEEWCEADNSQWKRKMENLKYVTKWE